MIFKKKKNVLFLRVLTIAAATIFLLILWFEKIKKENLTKLYDREIFSELKIVEYDYHCGFIQESTWNGWVEHSPKSMENKIQSGVWSVSNYFHESGEYGSGNDFYAGIRAFIAKYPNTQPTDLIFLTMIDDSLSRGEIRCVTNHSMTRSYISAWGSF